MYISTAANYSGGLECNEKSNLGARDSYICTLYQNVHKTYYTEKGT